MASSKIPTPSYTTGQNYELFKKEINIWEKITSIEKGKQGLHVLLNLPGKDRDPHGIKDKLLEVCDIDDLGKDDGLKSLLTTMDKYLGKDDLEDAWDRFQCFEDCKKSPSESWFDYITNFDNNYERIKSKGITLPASILAFKLLKGADLNDEERLIIMKGLDFTQKDELYNQAKKSLKNLNVEWVLQLLQLMISVVWTSNLKLLFIPEVAVVGHEAELIFTLLATAIVNLTNFVPMSGWSVGKRS